MMHFKDLILPTVVAAFGFIILELLYRDWGADSQRPREHHSDTRQWTLFGLVAFLMVVVPMVASAQIAMTPGQSAPRRPLISEASGSN